MSEKKIVAAHKPKIKSNCQQNSRIVNLDKMGKLLFRSSIRTLEKRLEGQTDKRGKAIHFKDQRTFCVFFDFFLERKNNVCSLDSGGLPICYCFRFWK
jgi:hypothetical protein